MPYNSVADRFHIKKLCSRLPSSEVWFLHGKWPFWVFELRVGIRSNVRCSSQAHY